MSNHLNDQQRQQLKKAREELCNAQILFKPFQEEYDELNEMIEWVEEILGIVS